MPLVHTTTPIAPFWLPNGHFQSIYPALFRKINDVPYQRERITTPDQDFLDLDWALAKGGREERRKGTKPALVILSHGLEGNSTRQYVLGMVRLLIRHGYDCLAWNYRSCSGEMNQQARFYHSGATDDLDLVVQHALDKGYGEIYLMGFSLGGNLTLKYAGEQGKFINPAIQKVVVFSVPMDLLACSRAIEKRENRIYLQRFLRTLKPKVEQKGLHFPEHIDASQYQLVKSFYDFDHIFTATIHGFESADDYYARSSAKNYVEYISVPTLIVNALNDPLIPPDSLPQQLIANHPNVWLELTADGGHCGFRPAQLIEGAYWSERRALKFLQEQPNY
ncbi:YheT family hydrolase [Telluribacter sp. SYSU D00476]|uniref:YheT family hydrolase n=1 Tax=Telluribacter sp. SYSU D00476 TaxID=2811430 RepID=UPI001FF47126|nr:alpha/beta fold hydrolase [Telluribacter sp. SYSU D00476]